MKKTLLILALLLVFWTNAYARGVYGLVLSSRGVSTYGLVVAVQGTQVYSYVDGAGRYMLALPPGVYRLVVLWQGTPLTQATVSVPPQGTQHNFQVP